MYDGGTIDLCHYKDININLEAYFYEGDLIESVTMTLTDYYTYEVLVTQTESAEPFMLGGDINGPPLDVLPLDVLKVPGYYKLEADPVPGIPTTFYFYVEECAVSNFEYPPSIGI